MSVTVTESYGAFILTRGGILLITSLAVRFELSIFVYSYCLLRSQIVTTLGDLLLCSPEWQSSISSNVKLYHRVTG